MNPKLELTPKDCLYIDDALTQLSAIKTRICSEKKEATNQAVVKFLEEVENSFTTQYDAIKKLLKEASE